MSEYEAVIGLEVHVELATRSKMFCGCPTTFGGEPNTQTCPVCLGQPGSLPVPNKRAIEYLMLIGLALDCTVAPYSLFHRKNYFYPDMPKNYQISQYDKPLCVGGHLDVDVDGTQTRIGITRAHMEEDTGKSLHVGASGRIADESSGKTSTLRSKEEAFDYRYFPEPDLVPIEADDAWISRIREKLPELPRARRDRIASEHGLTPEQAAFVSASPASVAYFQGLLAAG